MMQEAWFKVQEWWIRRMRSRYGPVLSFGLAQYRAGEKHAQAKIAKEMIGHCPHCRTWLQRLQEAQP